MHISIWYHPASIFIALLEHSFTWKKFNRKITVLTFSIRCFGLLHVILSRTTCYRNSFLTHGMLMLYACNPSVWEVVESKGSEVQNPFLLYFGFNTTLDNMGACSKKKVHLYKPYSLYRIEYFIWLFNFKNLNTVYCPLSLFWIDMNILDTLQSWTFMFKDISSIWIVGGNVHWETERLLLF